MRGVTLAIDGECDKNIFVMLLICSREKHKWRTEVTNGGALRRSIRRVPLLNSQVFARRGDGLAIDGKYDKNISVTLFN